MAEPWSEMEGRLKPSRSLEERLREYPERRAKRESLLAVVENAAGDVEKAAEAERRVTEEWRQLGNEALHGWARRQAQRKEEEVAQLLVAAKNCGYLARKDGGEWLSFGVDIKRGRLRPLEV